MPRVAACRQRGVGGAGPRRRAAGGCSMHGARVSGRAARRCPNAERGGTTVAGGGANRRRCAYNRWHYMHRGVRQPGTWRDGRQLWRRRLTAPAQRAAAAALRIWSMAAAGQHLRSICRHRCRVSNHAWLCCTAHHHIHKGGCRHVAATATQRRLRVCSIAATAMCRRANGTHCRTGALQCRAQYIDGTQQCTQ